MCLNTDDDSVSISFTQSQSFTQAILRASKRFSAYCVLILAIPGDIRSKLTLHLSAISAFCDGVQLSMLGRIQTMIIDLSKAIKRGDKEPSLLSVQAVEVSPRVKGVSSRIYPV